MYEGGGLLFRDTNPTKRSLQRMMLRRIFYRGFGCPITVACLPGATGWDIDYFLGRGAEVARIIGIERDADIAQALKAKYSSVEKVQIYAGTVTDFLFDAQEPVDLVYLDYCSNFGFGVMQDISLLLRRQLLRSQRGRCVVSFLNARESVKVQHAHRLLFDEMESRHPSGEEWASVSRDRRRCIAFNALLHRQRRTLSGQGGRVRAVVSPVYMWHRYATYSGSMLTGHFVAQGYDVRIRNHRNVVAVSPDKWYVRGQDSIRQRAPISVWNNFVAAEKAMGRDPMKRRAVQALVHFYEKHGRTPSAAAVGMRNYPDWPGLVRELGLCPLNNATLSEVKEELLRIHAREGVVRREHLHRASLADALMSSVTRGCVRVAYGSRFREGYGALLEEMGIPYDLRAPRDLKFHGALREWVNYLDTTEAPRKSSQAPQRLYSRMWQRGLLKEQDARARLQQLDSRYGALN